MSERKRYWEARLETDALRAGWWKDLSDRHLFGEVAATDLQCRADVERTLYLLGQRSTALSEFSEAKRLVPLLVVATISEALTPPVRQKKEQDADGNDADQPAAS